MSRLALMLFAFLFVATGCRKKETPPTEPQGSAPGQPGRNPPNVPNSPLDVLKAKGAVIRNHAWYVSDIGPTLQLLGPKFTDADVASLRSLTHFQEIYLDGAKVTDANLKVFAEFQHLRALSLAGTAVTDVGVAKLEPVKLLSDLYLNNTAVTDACYPTLSKLRNLRHLDVRKTKLGDATAQKLQSEIGALVVIQDAKFFDFTDPGGRFQVSFPWATPTRKTGTLSTTAGQVPLTMDEAVRPPMSASLSFADFDTPQLASADLEKIVEADRDKLAKQLNGKVAKDTRKDHGAGNSVRDVVYEFEHKGKQGPSYVRWVIHGRRMYTLTMAMQAHTLAEDEKDRFFNSFRVTR